MRYLSTLTFLFTVSVTFAQHTNFNSQRNWSLHKKELLFSIGATQFTGDLGGDDMIGTDYSLKDLDLQATSWNAMVGFRYRFHPMYSTTSLLRVGMLRANDAYTNECLVSLAKPALQASINNAGNEAPEP